MSLVCSILVKRYILLLWNESFNCHHWGSVWMSWCCLNNAQMELKVWVLLTMFNTTIRTDQNPIHTSLFCHICQLCQYQCFIHVCCNVWLNRELYSDCCLCWVLCQIFASSSLCRHLMVRGRWTFFSCFSEGLKWQELPPSSSSEDLSEDCYTATYPTPSMTFYCVCAWLYFYTHCKAMNTALTVHLMCGKILTIGVMSKTIRESGAPQRMTASS